ncbi:lipopolysaccharide biosynthesis protein [Marinobacter halotolerans]|uniref:lipopolysaccharide biosynthesis protein n=1 Tax=Marinobacter halotolerans TaxID=1569211 RepID=UPI001247F215|nr:oligosaccharide flippase family protein [Marinobacter halotolerans]
MSLAKKLFHGSVAQTLMTLVNIGVGFFMLPFMIGQLGESLYGVWILVGGFTASLYLFDFGFATAVTRFMARFISKGDDASANRVINSALVIYTGLSLLVLTVTLGIVWISPIWVEDPSNVEMVQLLIFLAGLSLAIAFPFKAFAGIATAYVRYDLMAWTRIAIKIIATACTIAALLSGYKLVAVALVQFGGSLLSDLATLFIARYLFKPLKLKYSFIDKSTIRSLAGYSGWAFLIDFTNLLKGKADIFMIAAFIGTGPLTVYYVAARLAEYSFQFLSKATGMSTPVFAAYEARGDHEGLRSKAILFVRINLLLGAYAAYTLLLLGEPLIRIWMGGEFQFQQAYYILSIMMIGRIVGFTFLPLNNVLLAISKPRIMAYLTMIEAAISLPLVYLSLAVLELGIIGAAAALALPGLFTRTIVLPLIIQKQIELSILRLYSNILKPLLLLFLATVLAQNVVLNFIIIDSLLTLIASGIAISIIYWALLLLSLSREEWGYIRKMLPDTITRRIPKMRGSP